MVDALGRMQRNLIFEYVRSPSEAKSGIAARIVQQKAAEAGMAGMSTPEATPADLEAQVGLEELLTVLLEDVLGIGWAFLPSGKIPSAASFQTHLRKV